MFSLYTPKKKDIYTPITPSVVPTSPSAFVPVHPTWRTTRFCSQGLGEDLVGKNGTSNFFNRKMWPSLSLAGLDPIHLLGDYVHTSYLLKDLFIVNSNSIKTMEVEHGMPLKGSFPLQKGDVPLNLDLMGARTNQMLQVPLAISEPKSIKCELWIKGANCSIMGGYVSTQKSDRICIHVLAAEWKNQTCDLTSIGIHSAFIPKFKQYPTFPCGQA